MKSLFPTLKNLSREGLFLSVFSFAVLTAASTIFSSAASAQVTQESLGNSAGQYIVEFTGNKLPNDLSARIASLGGTIVDKMPEMSVAIIGNMTNTAAAALRTQADVSDVT